MVTRLSGAVLEIDAHLDGQDRTGVFELRKDFEVTDEIRRAFVVEGGEIAARVLGLLQESDDNPINRQTFVIDGGGGQSSMEIRASLSQTEFDGSYLQMGAVAAANTSSISATGADARTQGDMLKRYAEQATTDSLNPARLHIGHYHDGTYSSDGDAGLFDDPREVYLPEVRIMTESDSPSSVDVVVQCILAGSLTEAVAAAEQESF